MSRRRRQASRHVPPRPRGPRRPHPLRRRSRVRAERRGPRARRARRRSPTTRRARSRRGRSPRRARRAPARRRHAAPRRLTAAPAPTGRGTRPTRSAVRAGSHGITGNYASDDALIRLACSAPGDMSDRSRRVAFTGAAVLLLALALLLNRRGSDPADRQPAQAPSSPVIERAPTPQTSSLTVQPAPTRAVPARQTALREREPRRAPAVASGAGRAAATAARVFLHAYLPYSYGRVDAARISGAALPFVRVLREAPPRVPAAVARARPRLVSVLAQAATGDRDVLIVAVVDDGRRRYDVRLTVHHGAGRWLVTQISG